MAVIEATVDKGAGIDKYSKEATTIISVVVQRVDDENNLSTEIPVNNESGERLTQVLFAVDAKLGLSGLEGEEPAIALVPLEEDVASPYLENLRPEEFALRNRINSKPLIAVCISIRPEAGQNRLMSAFLASEKSARNIANALVRDPHFLKSLLGSASASSQMTMGSGIRILENIAVGGKMSQGKVIPWPPSGRTSQ